MQTPEIERLTSETKKVLRYIRKSISRHFLFHALYEHRDGAFIISINALARTGPVPAVTDLAFSFNTVQLVYVAYGPLDLDVFRIGRPWEHKGKQPYQWQEIPLADPQCAEKVVTACDQIIRSLIWKKPCTNGKEVYHVDK